ncbi:DUF3667 domain-containing protein [Janthinobacterium sp. LB3P118]|uniref:DUF3667 domain-containing protein n=1 Tax=Janthinobacterium sp. LB3P118 TaxID=3424195 RepID=UPI003F1FDDDC
MLLFRPGALSNEYIAGRRVRYVEPLRVYLTFSILFFAILKFGSGDLLLPVDSEAGQVSAQGLHQTLENSPAQIQLRSWASPLRCRASGSTLCNCPTPRNKSSWWKAFSITRHMPCSA